MNREGKGILTVDGFTTGRWNGRGAHFLGATHNEERGRGENARKRLST